MQDNSAMQDARCKICKKTFANKSSLVRHVKRCTETPRPSLRQKACRPCAAVKARCDLNRPGCGRCALRKTSCQYLVTASQDQNQRPVTNRGSENMGFVATKALTDTVSIFPDMPIAYHDVNGKDRIVPIFDSIGEPFLDLTDSTRCPTLDLYDEIDFTSNSSNNSTLGLTESPWDFPFFPSVATTPPLTKHSMEYLFRVFRTWPRMMAREMQLPPIVHLSHISGKSIPTALANCYALSKIWYASSEEQVEVVQETILKEMQTLFKNYWSYDEANFVAALQALTIYLIMLLFPSKSSTTLPCLDNTIFSDLQTLVYFSINASLVLPEERQHSRPTWDSWVTASTKRRCILTLYIIHWCYSIYHCQPSFICEELSFMPAPAAKMLWQSQSKDHWECLYDQWLKSWVACGYLQGEFMMIQEGIKVDSRTEMWLEEADEFGMMFMSIVNAADREPLYHGAPSIKG